MSRQKGVVAWGVFRIAALPLYDNERLQRSSYSRMAVTSFGTTSAGNRMAYGRDENGHPTARKADGMFFYQSEEAMNAAIEEAQRIEPEWVAKVREAIEASATVQRQYRVEMESRLGKRAIQPTELCN